MEMGKKLNKKEGPAMAKILIIEDRRENIVFIANNVLKPLGHEVITALDGEIGLRKAEEESPDLIITDVKLPKIQGLDILERLRNKGIFIPAIVMTFHGTEETAVRALRLGARDYLIKPFTFEEMQAALDRALQSQPVTPEAYQEKMKAEARIRELEEKLRQLQGLLMQKDNLLKHMQQQSSNHLDHENISQIAEQTNQWERDNAKLNRMLAQAKLAFNKVEGRANALEEAIIAQKAQTNKYQKEAKRLANELRNLSEAMRLMSQDMEHQISRLPVRIRESVNE
jgi:DNA-binding response OmpR family regulator